MVACAFLVLAENSGVGSRLEQSVAGCNALSTNLKEVGKCKDSYHSSLSYVIFI